MARIFMAAYTNYRRDPRVKREAETLVETGHEVIFLALRQPGEPNTETIAGVKVVKVFGLKRKPTSFLGYIFDYLCFFFLMSFHLSFHPMRYSLIHVNNMPDFLVFAAWLPKLLGTPIIHDVHDLMPELYMEKFGVGEEHWMIRMLICQEQWAGRFATAVLTVEEGVKEILANRGLTADKISILINLPDERIFQPRPLYPSKSDDAPFRIVYHGTLARRLGLDVAMHAIAQARECLFPVIFQIIGAGEERERLLALRKELDLEEIVTFSDGFVPVEEIPQLIAHADVAVIPLRRSSGTEIMLPTKLLEYVQVGIPCIVPRTSTIVRYFDESMVCFFEAENPQSLAEALTDMRTHPEKCRSLAACASERFLKTYTWREHRNVYTNLVDSLLIEPRP